MFPDFKRIEQRAEKAEREVTSVKKIVQDNNKILKNILKQLNHGKKLQ